MKSIIVYIKQLPKPIQLTTIAYFGSSVLYTCVGSYFDSKEYLLKYRTNKIDEYDKKSIKSEWDAVKYGSRVNFWERFWSSLIWPYSVSSNIIPGIVLSLNRESKDDKDNKD
jgi:hypothetical protein